jgi:ascorbate-specific PTS system EIIC-type component UlaA
MKNIKIEIKWALLFVFMSLVWMCLEKFTGLHSTYIDYHLYLTNLFIIPAIWFFVLALKDKKRNFYHGEMSYKQGVISGLILTLLIAICNPLTQWITTYFITPEYFPNVIKRSVEIDYYQTTAEAEANFNYKNYAIQGTIGALIMGTITTLIVMLFLRTKKHS